MLAAVLIELERRAETRNDLVRSLIDVFESVLGERRERLDPSRDLDADVRRLLRTRRIASTDPSGATIHVSAVDGDGLGCSVTASSGYGSGDMPAGTGLWLNNCLGEIDLNRHGLDAGEPGRRLPSNMAPCCARRGDDVLSIGSPGASRITSALAQTLFPVMTAGQAIDQAIDAPRLHVDYTADGFTLAAERGVELPAGIEARLFEASDMYFGGVGAAWQMRGRLAAAADPRRTGAVVVTNAEN